MSAPYWGQLPAPKVTRGDSIRREENEAPRGNRNLAIDTTMPGKRVSSGYSAQTNSRQDRYSTQTDAPTISTQSPFASPIASEFRGDGLAPRPSSYQAGASEAAYNKDYLEKRRRRQSREQYAEPAAIAPPSVPDVPRAPPLSYKQPYSNGGPSSSQPPTRTRSTRKSEGPVKTQPEDYYRSQPGEEYIEENTAGIKREPSNGKAPVRYSGSQRQGSFSTPRRESLSETEEQRRREWAPDRSPLQRLELTLDSITKEEKRARVEEAELLARESKAGRGGERAAQNSVRFRNRPVAKGADPSSPIQPQTLPEAGLVRNLSTKQKDQLQRSGTVEKTRPVEDKNVHPSNTGGFDYQPQPKQDYIDVPRKTEQQQSTPQRKVSSRDRSQIPVAATAAVAGAALGRSGSNKLRKDPPGDPWFNRRTDAERQYPEVIAPRKQSVDGRQQATGTGPLRSHPQSARDKELPSLPAQAQQAPAPDHAIERLDLDSDEDVEDVPVRRGSKLERLTGASNQAMRANQAGNDIQTKRVMVNGIPYAIPQTTTGTIPKSIAHQPSIEHRHHLSNILHHRQHESDGQGVYIPSKRLDEWKTGGIALLSGALLDLEVNNQTEEEKDRAWWEAGNKGARRRSTTKQRKAEAYDGEYDESSAPTRFKPNLFLKSGPMLRYCGLRQEKAKSRSTRSAAVPDREIWRGTIMIVTQDAHSSYELAPTLRLFVQPIDLMPPPPAQVDGEDDELAPEYIDPLAGLPKLGRDGRTLYVRPVDHLEESKDLSREESDNGLFEMHRSPLDGGADRNPACNKIHHDGEKAGKYKEVRGFRLHAEHGVTFWRFNVEIELRDKQQRIAYRINRGPATGFWVPARGQSMNIMFSSCNGFSHDVDPNAFCGPDPMWRDVLNTHQTQPFHVMLGGGDQIYNDCVAQETTLFKQWMSIRDSHHKEGLPFTPELQHELETFYLDRYCMWFSQGLFGIAVSQIPMINIFDDHDIIDGFGSYPDDFQRSAVFSGLGSVAFKYYMLFQHQSSIDEGEDTEPSWILGTQPGPYIQEMSRSVFTNLGREIAFLGLDCRTERMFDEVVSTETYHKVFDRLEKDIIKGETKHLIVLLGVPIAYPRMVWLENILTSRALEPIKAMGRAGMLGKKLLNHMDGSVELLDDLNDHWTAKHHKEERNWFIQELQDLAAMKSVRITILGGDVHLGAIGQFYSNPKLGLPKDRDFRYMPNVISSAITNTPPPDTLADVLNKRNKVHHLDADTDEDMIPIFTHDVNGKPRNNKRLLNRRNWCSIRLYNPELTPPSTPISDRTPSPPPRGGLLRRLSSSRGPTYRPDAHAPAPATTIGFFSRRETTAPPLSSPGFFARKPSTSTPRRASTSSERPSVLTRTLSLTRKDFSPGNLFRRSSKPKRRPDDGGINGYGASSDEDSYNSYDETPPARTGMRGGAGGPDSEEEDSYFPAQPLPAHPAPASQPSLASAAPPQRSQFHRTPTGLSVKQLKKAKNQDVNLEGGLDICLNMEINPKDPAGITAPYRLLVPALFHEEPAHGESLTSVVKPGKLKRWGTFSRGKGKEKSDERDWDGEEED